MPKSQAPRAKPKTQTKKKNIAGWDMLHQEHDVMMHSLHTPNLLAPLLKDKRIDAKFVGEERVKIAQDLTILGKDALYFANQLNEIQAKHADKTGEPKTPDERMEIIMIDQEYKSIYSCIETVFNPTVLSTTVKLERKRDEVIEDQNKILSSLAKKEN